MKHKFENAAKVSGVRGKFVLFFCADFLPDSVFSRISATPEPLNARISSIIEQDNRLFD